MGVPGDGLPYHCLEVLRGGGCFFGFPARPPSDWLHCLHMTLVLSTWSRPPLECGMMWSTSADSGVSPRV